MTPFLFRSVIKGQVVAALAGRLIAETDAYLAIATLPGDMVAWPIGDRLEILERIEARTLEVAVRPWHTSRVLWLLPHNRAYAFGHFWNESGAFQFYYVNLEEVPRRTSLGVDAGDQVLDVVVAPDGSWRWKDEDELAHALSVGMFSPDEAAAIRAEGERVIAELPTLLPTGWEDWQPDPDWPPIPLPEGWDQL